MSGVSFLLSLGPPTPAGCGQLFCQLQGKLGNGVPSHGGRRPAWRDKPSPLSTAVAAGGSAQRVARPLTLLYVGLAFCCDKAAASHSNRRPSPAGRLIE